MLTQMNGGITLPNTLLSSQHFSQLIMLEFLMENPDTDIAQLKKITKSSEKTILAYLDELESGMKFFSYKKKNNSIKLVSNNQFSYNSMYTYFYDQSTNLQALEIIFLHPYIKTNDLAERLEISISKCIRIKNHINSCLAPYDISITDSPFLLTGSVKNIVNFFVPFFYEKYGFSNEFMTVNQYKVLLHIVTSFTSVFPHLNGVQDTHRLTIWLWVIIKISRHDPQPTPSNSEQPLRTDTVIVNKDRFSEAFGFNYSQPLHRSISRLFTLLLSENPVTIGPSVNGIEHFLTSFYGVFNTENPDSPLLLYRAVLAVSTGKNFILNNEKKRFVLSYFNRYGHFSEQRSLALKKELQLLKNTLKNDNLYFELLYLILTHETKLVDTIKKNQLKTTVGLIYTLDIEHSKMIQTMLNELFQGELDFKLIDYNFFDPFDDTRYECHFYLTNLPIINNPKVILTDVYPSERELGQLVRTFKQNTTNQLLNYLKTI